MAARDFLFSDYDLRTVLDDRAKRAVERARALPEGEVDRGDLDELVEGLVLEFRGEPLDLIESEISIEHGEAKVDVSGDYGRAISDRSRLVEVDGVRVAYFVPFRGDPILFRCQPASYTLNRPQGRIAGNELVMEYCRPDQNVAETKPAFERDLGNVRQYVEWVRVQITEFNAALPRGIRQALEERRRRLQEARKQVAEVGFKPRAASGRTTPSASADIPSSSTSQGSGEPRIPEHQQTEAPMKFHVLAARRRKEERFECIFKDLTEAELRERFVVPYEQGQNLFSAGKIVRLQNIASIKIIATRKPIGEELQRLQEKTFQAVEESNRDGSGVLIFPPVCGEEDIGSAGSDVTSEFVSGPLGTRPRRTKHTERREPGRVLTTVLFTDIVDSTKHLGRLGDLGWGDLRERHNTVARREIARFGGQEVKTTGDGLLVTFGTPAQAIRCAAAIRDGMRDLGLEIRPGLHAGEVDQDDEDVHGITVNIASRVSATAEAGEVLVSRTVKDLVAGSGIGFLDRGTHALKGVDGEWQLFAADF
jgi:class 3 adenylate cyclase